MKQGSTITIEEIIEISRKLIAEYNDEEATQRHLLTAESRNKELERIKLQIEADIERKKKAYEEKRILRAKKLSDALASVHKFHGLEGAIKQASENQQAIETEVKNTPQGKKCQDVPSTWMSWISFGLLTEEKKQKNSTKGNVDRRNMPPINFTESITNESLYSISESEIQTKAIAIDPLPTPPSSPSAIGTETSPDSDKTDDDAINPYLTMMDSSSESSPLLDKGIRRRKPAASQAGSK